MMFGGIVIRIFPGRAVAVLLAVGTLAALGGCTDTSVSHKRIACEPLSGSRLCGDPDDAAVTDMHSTALGQQRNTPSGGP